VLVAVHGRSATYTLLDGEPLDIAHYGEQATVSDKELTLDIPAIVPPPPPTQPPGRVPQPHRARSS
jgi:alpha,alpha-trehalose phosphorylase